MSNTPLVLAISDDRECLEDIRGALAPAGHLYALQTMERLRTALARIAGGGVHAVLMDLSSAEKTHSEKLESFLKLRAAAEDLPIVVLCGADDGTLPAALQKVGAFACIPRARWAAEAGGIIASALETRADASRPALNARDRRSGIVIAMLGAKGGVGATSVALNLASSWVRNNDVILAELRPGFGNLTQYLRPQAWVRGIAQLLEMRFETITQANVEACLWPARNIPGLSVLFAPQSVEGSGEIRPEHAQVILSHLAAAADLVLLDLTASLSELNRAVLRKADVLTLVLERDAVCVEAAKVMLQAMEAAGIVPRQAGAVIVNRTPLASPMPLAEIESHLGIPTFGVIPPAADFCAAAQRARVPVIAFDPESTIAGSLTNLANELLRSISPAPRFQLQRR